MSSIHLPTHSGMEGLSLYFSHYSRKDTEILKILNISDIAEMLEATHRRARTFDYEHTGHLAVIPSPQGVNRHNRTTRSSPPVAMRSPFGSHATTLICAPW